MSDSKRVKRHVPEALPLGPLLGELADDGVATADLALPLTDKRVAPPVDLRNRLMASIDGTHRFGAFEDRFAELSDLPGSVASLLLGRVDDSIHWSKLDAPGVELFHFDGGPKLRDAITGFVRMKVGAIFPTHEHMGEESVLILQGALRDDDGEVYGPGDEIQMSAHSSHSFSAVGDIPLLFVAIVMKGLTINGQFIPPGDPRA